MNAKDAIGRAAGLSAMVLDSYYADFTDEELMKRPGPGCNHLAWQIGHLIASECGLLEAICPGKAAELPEGFAERHSTDNVADDDPSHFHSKDEYTALAAKVREATAAALAEFPEADLDGPSPERFRSRFPTVGDIFMLIATHPMMHAGQFVPVRRELDKPVVI